MELFKIENLVYGDFLPFPDLTMEAGKNIFLVGKSGCGKSTLLKLLNATYSPSQGNIYYLGKNLLEYNTIELRREVGLVGQEVFLFDGTIEENFRQFYKFRSLPVPSNEEIEKLLNMCCLNFSLTNDCNTMSGGERQRLYLTILLSFKPKVALLDEPTSALDSVNTNEVMGNILTYCKENQMDVVVVSHDPEMTSTFAENMITLERGLF